VNQFNLWRQEFVETVPHYGMCLTATNFHYHPLTRDSFVDLAQQAFCQA
jgi:hypothetical protein